MREQSKLHSIELRTDLAHLALAASLAPGDSGGRAVTHIPHTCRHLGVLLGMSKCRRIHSALSGPHSTGDWATNCGEDLTAVPS